MRQHVGIIHAAAARALDGAPQLGALQLDCIDPTADIVFPAFTRAILARVKAAEIRDRRTHASSPAFANVLHRTASEEPAMMTQAAVDPVEATAAAVTALLTAIDRAPSPGAIVAYRAAIARHGRNLQATAGDASMVEAFVRIQADAPDPRTAAERERIVREVWEEMH